MVSVEKTKELLVAPSKMAIFLVAFAGVFVVLVWFFTISRIQQEKELEIQAAMRTNFNLVKAFEENVRQNLRSIDEILSFLQRGYQQHGKVTPEMMARMQNTGHIPTVHVSLINEQGRIFSSSLPGLIGMDVSTMEYFQHFRLHHENRPYFGKPVVGRLTRQPLFHMSRILYKTDGSFGGALNFGVEPRYFAEYYNKMELGQGQSIAIVGLDGFSRVSQSAQGMRVGDNVSAGPAFRRIASGSPAGSVYAVTPITQEKSLISYLVMPDYPFAVITVVPEQQVLDEYWLRRKAYLSTAVFLTLAIITAVFFLHRLLHQKLQTEMQLNHSLIEIRAQRLLQKEIELAGKIQADILPGDFADERVQIRTLYKPYRYVSGDSYNYVVSADKDTVRGYLIDVTGHGISTALQTAAIRTILNDELAQDSPWTVETLKRLENRIQQHLSEESFVAALLFTLDCRQQLLHGVIAGINHFLLANGQNTGWVTVKGGYIGISSDMEFGELTVPFQAGDSVYFVTDGIYDKLMPEATPPVEDFDETMRSLRDIADSPDCRDDRTAIGIRVSSDDRRTIVFSGINGDNYSILQPRISRSLSRLTSGTDFAIEVAMGEAVTNALRFGSAGSIRITLKKIGGLILIRVRDEGDGFWGNRLVAQIRQNGADVALQSKYTEENGRGIAVMVLTMDRVIYNQKGNEVLLVKRIHSSKEVS